MNKRNMDVWGMLVCCICGFRLWAAQLIIDAVKSAIIGQPDVIISAQQIAEIPYATFS